MADLLPLKLRIFALRLDEPRRQHIFTTLYINIYK